MTLRPVLYDLPGTDRVLVRHDLLYREADGAGADALTFDLYAPPEPAPDGAQRPVVVFASGYPDPGFAASLGCRFKEMAAYVSWGRLVAASGLCAVVYSNREPAADLATLLAHLRAHGAELGIDRERIAIWACSGNVHTALTTLLRDAPDIIRAAALWYGYMLDLDGSSIIAQVAAAYGSVPACAGKTVADLRSDVPLFVARAGRDETPGLNETVDRFVSHAIAANLPLTFANHPTGPHAFDLLDDSPTTRHLVREVLAFLRSRLGLEAAGT
ncbi:MAG: alpha/beta hydrolase [Myxococcota bacterium]